MGVQYKLKKPTFFKRGQSTEGRTRTGTWCEPDWILSPARLPIPPLRQKN